MPLRSVLVTIAATLLLCGCGAGDDWSRPHGKPTPVGTLGPGFVDAPPAPEATITPRPGSWNGVHPPKGYRVVLLTSGTAHETNTLAAAVTSWAEAEDVSLKTVTSADAHQAVPSIVKAMGLKPDLIICAGNTLVDALAVVTANHLAQNFLVLGAEVAEPTYNVTAADWPGASFRGEGLEMPDAYDPASFTGERAGRAVRAGVAAVLHGLTGIVIRLQ